MSAIPFGPLDPSGILCRPPLDPSAGVCYVKRKVERSIPPGSNFSPYLLDGKSNDEPNGFCLMDQKALTL
jgi:hypothetical protein